jgi:hypothetical protein
VLFTCGYTNTAGVFLMMVSNPPDLSVLHEAFEQQQKRKVTHSAIERKRRDRMNEKINVLRKLVPTASSPSLPKLSVLEATIDYIISLQQLPGDTINSTSGVAVQPHQLRISDLLN